MTKSIIIKSNTDDTIKQLVDELCEYPNIRFLFKKLNGENTLIIKCYNYYDKFAKENAKNFYGNYIYLYTCVSLILSDLIIKNYEKILVNRILRYNYFYFGKAKLKKINNLVSLILNPDSPLENACEFMLYRKQIILSKLLKNFRKTNFLHIDSFINFSLTQYNEFLEEIIFDIIRLYLSNLVSLGHLNVTIKTMMYDMDD